MMKERLAWIRNRCEELNAEIAEPSVIADYPRYQSCLKELDSMQEVISVADDLEKTETEIAETEKLLKDPEMATLATEELATLKASCLEQQNRLALLLIPPNPLDNRNVVLELRAGAGGEEAALFCGDLLRMYRLYAQEKGLQFSVLNLSDSSLGGVNEALAAISGADAYGLFKYESGVHAVKRVPVTESSGRIHTSTVTVAVLPEAEEVELKLDPADIRTDVFHATGHGGQGVNTTDSAVRLTHIPTGTVVTCQDERSQLENKARALKVLRSRLLDKLQSEQSASYAENRRSQIGTGDRSERIRTYYFNHDYVVDGRLGTTVNRTSGVMNGHLDPFVSALRMAEKNQRLDHTDPT